MKRLVLPVLALLALAAPALAGGGFLPPPRLQISRLENLPHLEGGFYEQFVSGADWETGTKVVIARHADYGQPWQTFVQIRDKTGFEESQGNPELEQRLVGTDNFVYMKGVVITHGQVLLGTNKELLNATLGRPDDSLAFSPERDMEGKGVAGITEDRWYITVLTTDGGIYCRSKVPSPWVKIGSVSCFYPQEITADWDSGTLYLTTLGLKSYTLTDSSLVEQTYNLSPSTSGLILKLERDPGGYTGPGSESPSVYAPNASLRQDFQVAPLTNGLLTLDDRGLVYDETGEPPVRYELSETNGAPMLADRLIATPTWALGLSQHDYVQQVFDETSGQVVRLPQLQRITMGSSYGDSVLFTDASYGALYELKALPRLAPHGDLNNDGTTTIQDVVLALKAVIGLTTLDSLGFWEADMNQNGRLEIGDAVAILKALPRE